MHNGISICAICSETGSFSPLSNVQIGKIKAESIIFAPIIFPTDKEDSFFRIAVTVVTSSGKDVPIATIVTEIIASLICRISAILQAECTSNSEPATIHTAPIQNQKNVSHILLCFSFHLLLLFFTFFSPLFPACIFYVISYLLFFFYCWKLLFYKLHF